MNNVQLTGRVTKDTELKQTTGGIPVAQFTIAVNNKAKGNEYTEFIDCVVWRELASAIAQYLTKGKFIAVCGSLHKRMYEDKNKAKHYVTEVNVNSIEFLDKKSDSTAVPDETPVELADDGVPI